MKQQSLDLLLEVYLSEKGEVLDIDLVRKHSSVDNQTVASIKSQLKRKDFFQNFGVKNAFFRALDSELQWNACNQKERRH